MKKVVSVLGLLLILVAGLVRVASVQGRRGPEPLSGADPGPGRTPPTSVPLLPAGLPVPAAFPADRGAPTRERAPLRPLAGLLGEHDPGALALLTWTPLLAELEGVRHVNAIDFERLRALTVATTSDAGGRFAFPGFPEGLANRPSVVWITEAGREARSVRLEPVEDSPPWPADGAAVARAPVRVVVRRAGAPVAGAHLRHTLSFWEPGRSEDEQRVRRVFLRDLVTGSDGAATIVPGSGENALLAEEGGGRSPLWLGEPERELVLELLPAIAVAGRIRTDDAALTFDGVRYNAGYSSAADRSDLVLLSGSVGVRPDGSFGPDLWPRLDARELTVYAAGGEVVPVQVTVAAPPAGESAWVELLAVRGHPFEVAVADPAGATVQGAAVRASHWTGKQWLTLRQELTGADGRAVLCAPAGPLYVEVAKPGFATLAFDDERTLVPRRAGPLEVVLRPAGIVSGFVHHGAEPVQRFQLVAWDDDRSYCPQIPIEDEEGAFRLVDVPKGETVHLFAFSERMPQSDTAVFVLEDEPLELDLDLPAPCKARGRVIDSLTREPVSTATIQHLTSGMGGAATYRGTPVGVQADGSFELDGFGPGRGGFAVVAEGYETLFYSTREDQGAVIDAGLMVLHPLSVLELRVLEAGVSDFAGYTAWNRHNFDGEKVPLAGDGTLALPSRTGPFELSVARPDGTVSRVSGIVLPGEHRRIELDLSGGIELALALEEPPERVASWTAGAFSCAGQGERWAQGRWSEERAAFLLRGLAPGDVVLELRDTAGGLVLQRSVRLADVAQQSLTLALGGERRRLRLQDGRGRPWASRPVVVTLGDDSGWFAQKETDSAGELELGPLDARRVVLSAKLANESIAYGVPVELEPDPARTTTVALDVGPRSLLLLTELGRPQAGVSVAYKHERGPRSLEFGYSSDEAGRIRGPFLGPGMYTVRVNHARFWPARYQVTGRDSTDPLPLELFSRATLALTVTDRSGRPLAGATLALEHAELGQSASEWLAAGLLTLPGGLVTDSGGRLLLTGVPRGTYAWTCTSPGGSSASGRASVAPGERGELAVRIDER